MGSTTDGPVARAAAIVELLREHAATSERLRQLAPESVAAMTDAGLWRILVARSSGGDEAGLRAHVDSAMLAGAADPAAGWVQMVSGAHAWMVGSFSPDAQAEVFAAGPDVVVPGTLSAQGTATAVAGGWRLDGRWQFASGVDHGDWLLIGARAAGSDDVRSVHVLVPTADVVVDDTWFTLGLRGTGSKDVVAEGAFVPAHRAMSTRVLFEGRSPHGEAHATHLNRVPVLMCLNVQFAAAVVGIATGAWELWIERTRTRRDFASGVPKVEDPGIQARAAESTTELHVARTLVQAAADRCDVVGATGERLTMDERAELKWHTAYAAELCQRATARLYAAAGAHAVYDDSLLQSRFRDVTTACHHGVADIDGNARMYGRVVLGLDPGTPFV